MTASYGPTIPISQETHAAKYRAEGETFTEAMTRIADALKDDEEHFRSFRDTLLNMRFLPAGRVQAAMGLPRKVTPYNCFVMNTLPDSMDGIMNTVSRAAMTMRLGGGVGYDFSPLRPRGDLIVSLDSKSSGPVSFMKIPDAVCGTIQAAGHRRGAQMGVLRIDHPDIEEFITCKQNSHGLTNFNISIAITDEFMVAVEEGTAFHLKFGGRVYKTVDARALWDKIMRSTWEWAEPGVLFIDTINRMNNLWYCETIAATNPCAEQPLPPNGACLLGSFNLVKYIIEREYTYEGEVIQRGLVFDWDLFQEDIKVAVRAMDNVVDRAIYPLPEQEHEAKSKRRMGLGITGLANAGEALGHRYGDDGFLAFTHSVMAILRDTAYMTSADLAEEKGVFPEYVHDLFTQGNFFKSLPWHVQQYIDARGMHNSHLISIAPPGTISLSADTVSSGGEPVFAISTERTIKDFDGQRIEQIEDYGYRVFGVKGKTSAECTADDHVNVLLTLSKYVDSAVSKTCNVSPDMAWEDFKNIYYNAWKGGARGCTTYNPGGQRKGILNAAPSSEENEGAACYIDDTGRKTCD